MKYEDWVDEKDLNKVCKELLDNADMDYFFNNSPLSIEFVFYVVGSNIKVIFNCSEISRMHIQKEYDDVPIHLVLEVNVCEENGNFFVQIMPEFNLELECRSFNWEIREFTKEEQEKVYPNA